MDLIARLFFKVSSLVSAFTDGDISNDDVEELIDFIHEILTKD